MADSIAQGMMRELCNVIDKFRLLFMLAVVMFVISVLWIPFVSPGTGTWVVLWMNVAGATGFGILAGTFILLCRRRKQKRREAEYEEYRRRS